MRSPTKSIILATCLCCITFLVSCSRADTEPDDGEQEQAVLSIVMRATRANGVNSSGEYEEGTDYENAINTAGGDYRILFFDTDNKYLGRCYGIFTTTNATDYTEYKFHGIVPDTLTSKSAFKIVVLANWEMYNEALTVGTTTINDLCNANWAQFNWDNNSTKEIINGTKHIPFFGVRKFSGVTFTKGETTTLSDPITLLRAVAKVEVSKENTKENEDYTLSEVSLSNYNTKGFCAPLVNDKDDYDHDYVWSMDFVHALHLVNDQENHTDKINFFHDMEKDKWIAYIPEYQNLTEEGTVRTDGYKSVINVKFDFQLKTDTREYEVNLAKYNENTNVVKEYLNIERNNLYRYVINFAKGKIMVTTGDWVDVHDNDYYFDL